ncbi:BamA/TamA family outer membrane protein [Mucilaginibacter calamicampi]|uniref:BamA/TamA family outer membrane protein n=1 Tax=Mucilaginibacter calamicampi TaxID=1302352 RepID=A0ABW2YRI3_9SPHI
MVFNQYRIGILTFFLAILTAQTFAQGDSVTIAIEPAYDKVGGAHRLFFGEGYRKLWATPVKMRVFHLAKEKGGLKILQRGGGYQTKSLRLEDATGQEWVIRTIQKYPERVLPATLRKTIAASIIQDQIAAEHPFSALIVPPLAKALSIPHASPEVVFVPDDPAFGEQRADFANQVFLFEEREPLDAKKTDNTAKTQDRLKEDNDNTIDQKTVLRARLLDMLLGDWDRHEDQWRWERTKGANGTVYEPVPRDRDQVFYNTSGVLPWLVSRHLLMSKFQSYEDHIRSINRWNFNARSFDRYFLNGLNQQDWEAEIANVQKALTNDLISRSVKLMPADIYKQGGAELASKMIARRDFLKKQALKYYRFLSSTVEIRLSDKNELFDITNQADGKVSVVINKIKKDGSKDQVIYQRVFDPKITDEIRLYGMDGEDIFKVHGNNNSPIKIRMIGGGGEDTYNVDNTLPGKSNRLVYDRADKKNNIADSGLKLRLGTDSTVNSFDKFGFKYDFFQPLILGSFNKDYGLQVIGNFVWQKHGFRKEPYAYRQSLLVNYGFTYNSLLLSYNGIFKNAIGKSDLVISALNKGPNYTSNFFGVGNNTVFENTGDRRLRYYQNVYNYSEADIRVKHTYDSKWNISGGLVAQYYNGDADDNTDRFLKAYDLEHPNEKVFATQANVGLVAGFGVDTRNVGAIPHKGVYWNTNLLTVKSLNSSSHTFGQIQTEFSFYVDPLKDSVLVLAVRTGGGTSFGNPSYYQQLKLGGNQNLRGYYIGRFTGKSMVYNNIELRLKVLDFASYLLPGTLGLVGFNDVGRVWSPGETSSQWHLGYGGGIYFLPAQLLLIQGVVGFSKEGAYPYIQAGFRF